MTRKIDNILKKVLDGISVSEKEYKEMSSLLNKFIKKLKEEITKEKISAQVFVGGSFAKKTLFKKEKYDADLFIRFDKKYKNEEISEMLKKILENLSAKEKVHLIHGSRDYFKIFLTDSFYAEIVPVRKISSVKEFRNTTDLSYFHVKYLSKKIKDKKTLEQIRLAKSFINFSKCYGAESYISGFSGYSIELLILHYKTFENFLKSIVKIKEQEIIDIEKHYKNKNEIRWSLNSSKLQSPIILIDPTHKQRNALAALSKETFEKFKKTVQAFLKNPSEKFFKQKEIDLEKIKKNAIKNKREFKIIRIETEKQEGDIAGSKLLKFYKSFLNEFSKFYSIYESGFNYSQKDYATFYIVLKKKKEIIFNGPPIENKLALNEFKKAHKKIEIKGKKSFARREFNLNFDNFFRDWKKKESKKIKEMYITRIKII